MKYEYAVLEKHGKDWWMLNISSSLSSAKQYLKELKTIMPGFHYRISRRPVGKWEIIKEV